MGVPLLTALGRRARITLEDRLRDACPWFFQNQAEARL
jgi:hypothetical protein